MGSASHNTYYVNSWAGSGKAGLALRSEAIQGQQSWSTLTLRINILPQTSGSGRTARRDPSASCGAEAEEVVRLIAVHACSENYSDAGPAAAASAIASSAPSSPIASVASTPQRPTTPSTPTTTTASSSSSTRSSILGLD